MIDGVHLSSLSPQRSSSNQSVERVGSFYVPPILPPINRYTLQELDLDAIMKNPQLRHDLLFDIGLQFRPTDSKRKRETSDMYWCAVKSELEAGCSCVSFDDMRHMHRHACHCATNARNADRKLKETCEHLPCEDSLPIHIPLRIGPLVEELREVVLAVVIPPSPPVPIRSGTPGTHPPNHVLRPRRLTVPEEASVAWLHEAFDVPLIEQQLRHGVFDPGNTCAPARDPMLDAMIGIAGKCGPGKEGRLVDALAAIRMCFELLEFMRLDLANHLLAHLRPHLLASAPQFEGAIFERRVDPDIPVTRAWLSKSYEKITSTPDLHNAVGAVLPPPNQLKSLSSVLKIVATVLPALVDLIVFPPIKTSATLPTSPTTTPVTKKQPTYQVSVQPGYPETLYLDHSRLLMLTADAADITASFMFLSMFRQFVYASPPKKGKRISVSDDELVQLKREIAAVGPPRPGVCFCKDHGLKDGTAQTENPNLSHWRNSMLLPLTAKDADGESSTSFAPPDAELVDSVTNWCSTHMHADSAVSLVFRKKLAVALLKALIPRFFAFWNAGVQQRLGQNQSPFAVEDAPREPGAEDDLDGLKTKTGLEPLSEEIRVLAERLAKLAVLHLRVYFPFYDQGGFLPA
ncbi:T-complex protein 11-domain-containing protein [Phellopilus nigrolimitatus]|nr:T-complex protein 11-domain-containing protein [Phellopilus nigrolimitatus]